LPPSTHRTEMARASGAVVFGAGVVVVVVARPGIEMSFNVQLRSPLARSRNPGRSLRAEARFPITLCWRPAWTAVTTMPSPGAMSAERISEPAAMLTCTASGETPPDVAIACFVEAVKFRIKGSLAASVL